MIVLLTVFIFFVIVGVFLAVPLGWWYASRATKKERAKMPERNWK